MSAPWCLRCVDISAPLGPAAEATRRGGCDSSRPAAWSFSPTGRAVVQTARRKVPRLFDPNQPISRSQPSRRRVGDWFPFGGAPVPRPDPPPRKEAAHWLITASDGGLFSRRFGGPLAQASGSHFRAIGKSASEPGNGSDGGLGRKAPPSDRRGNQEKRSDGTRAARPATPSEAAEVRCWARRADEPSARCIVPAPNFEIDSSAEARGR